MVYGKIIKTRFKELGVTKVDSALWRIVDLTHGDPSVVGPFYRSKAEAFGDLDRYAHDFGCMDTATTFDGLRETVARMTDGFATHVHCKNCNKLCAVVFTDFTAISADGADSWAGTADEHDTMCEACADLAATDERKQGEH